MYRVSKTSLTLKFNALASLGTALVQPRYTTIRRRIGTRDGKNRSKREEPSGLIDRRGRDVLKDGTGHGELKQTATVVRHVPE